MILEAITQLGSWSWWILGVILIGIEVFAPGTFFLWLGLAAFVVGAVSLVVGEGSSFWLWQTQFISFAVLAVVFAVLGRIVMRKDSFNRSQAPDLNERGQQLVGASGILSQPIEGGYGRVRLGETTWRVNGPELPEGTKVKVVSANAETLVVEAM